MRGRVIRAVPALEPRPVVLGQLVAHSEAEWRLAVVPGLLDPGNRALLSHLSGARRVLVVPGGKPVDDLLFPYLEHHRDAGVLDAWHVAPNTELVAESPLSAVAQLAENAADEGLSRHDVVLVCGHQPAALAAIATAALLRPHATAIQVVSDLPAVLAAVRASVTVPLPGPYVVPRRRVRVVVDEDTLLAGPPTPEEHAALCELARIDGEVAEALDGLVAGVDAALTTARRAALAATFRWFGQAWLTRTARHAGAPTGRTVSYQVVAVHDVFGAAGRADARGSCDATDAESAGDHLAKWLPADGRVLAVVDAFSPRVVEDVHRYLRWHEERRSIAGHDVIEVASSPEVKTLGRLDRVVRAADHMKLGPDDLVIGVGGGTVLDIVGTAALVYRGGTPYLRIPTTLAGMIDAGIGLRVAVDVGTRKNLLGGYHAPLACLCDRDFLRTLPSAELRCGLAEAIKIAAVADADLLELIERHHRDVLAGRNTASVRCVIDRSIAATLGELAANPFERHVRQLHDFGHEYGRLMESASGYRLRHGEAVSIGMALTSQLAVLTGRLAAADHARLSRLLTQVGLPTYDRLCEPERLWRWLHIDIAAYHGGTPHLVAPTAIGAGGFIEVGDGLSLHTLREACSRLASGRP